MKGSRRRANAAVACPFRLRSNCGCGRAAQARSRHCLRREEPELCVHCSGEIASSRHLSVLTSAIHPGHHVDPARSHVGVRGMMQGTRCIMLFGKATTSPTGNALPAADRCVQPALDERSLELHRSLSTSAGDTGIGRPSIVHWTLAVDRSALAVIVFCVPYSIPS